MDTLIQKLKQSKGNILELSDLLAEAEKQKDALSVEMTAAYAQLSFWERNFSWLFFLFKWDATNIINHETLQGKHTECLEKIKLLALKRINESASIDDLVRTHLAAENAHYMNLLVPYQKNKETYQIVIDYHQEIEEAIDALSSAQGMETLDLVTSNNAISLLSTFQNSNAKGEVDDVENGTQKFVKAIERYNDFFKGYQLPVVQNPIDDVTDLVFDLAFDGFDFLSICTLSSLSNAQNELEELESKVVEVKKIIYKNLTLSEALVKKYEEDFIASIK